MPRYIFANVIPSGQIDWKKPLTAEGQPDIREYFLIVAGDDDGPQVTEELAGPGAVSLCRYASLIAHGDTVVVGHSVEYQHAHLRASMISNGLDPCDGRVKTVCTMFSLTGIAPKANGRKGWPTFGEACAWAGVERAATETAEDNARSLHSVFRAMQAAGVVPEAKVWKERHSNG